MPSVHRADDGTPLEVKEAIVLDVDGNTIAEPARPSGEQAGKNRVFVFRSGGWLLPLIAAIVLPVLIFFGLAFVGVFLFLLLLALWVRGLFRAFFTRR